MFIFLLGKNLGIFVKILAIFVFKNFYLSYRWYLGVFILYSEQFMMYLAEYKKEDIKEDKKDKGILSFLFRLFELIKD